MRRGSILGKSASIGGAVGLLFPDIRRKEKKDRERERARELQRELELEQERDRERERREREKQAERDRERVREKEQEREKERERERRRRKEEEREKERQSKRQTTEVVVIAKSEATKVKPKRKPPPKELPPLPEPLPPPTQPPPPIPTPAATSWLAPPSSRRHTPPSPQSPGQLSLTPSGETSAVEMDPSVATFISARRRALRGSGGAQPIESGSDTESLVTSIHSSTLFYNPSTARQRAAAAAVAAAHGLPLPPSSPATPGSPGQTFNRQPSRLSGQSYLGVPATAVGGASDTDDGKSETADDRSERSVNVEIPNEVKKTPSTSSLNDEKKKSSSLISLTLSIGSDGKRTPKSGTKSPKSGAAEKTMAEQDWMEHDPFAKDPFARDYASRDRNRDGVVRSLSTSPSLTSATGDASLSRQSSILRTSTRLPAPRGPRSPRGTSLRSSGSSGFGPRSASHISSVNKSSRSQKSSPSTSSTGTVTPTTRVDTPRLEVTNSNPTPEVPETDQTERPVPLNRNDTRDTVASATPKSSMDQVTRPYQNSARGSSSSVRLEVPGHSQVTPSDEGNTGTFGRTSAHSASRASHTTEGSSTKLRPSVALVTTPPTVSTLECGVNDSPSKPGSTPGITLGVSPATKSDEKKQSPSRLPRPSNTLYASHNRSPSRSPVASPFSSPAQNSPARISPRTKSPAGPRPFTPAPSRAPVWVNSPLPPIPVDVPPATRARTRPGVEIPAKIRTASPALQKWYYHPTSPTGKVSVDGGTGKRSFEGVRSPAVASPSVASSGVASPSLTSVSASTSTATLTAKQGQIRKSTSLTSSNGRIGRSPKDRSLSSSTSTASASAGRAAGRALQREVSTAGLSSMSTTTSTTSLNSSRRLLTLCPPSLSAVAGGSGGPPSSRVDRSKTSRLPRLKASHAKSDSETDSDMYSSGSEEAQEPKSPSPFDFSTPRPGFLPPTPPPIAQDIPPPAVSSVADTHRPYSSDTSISQASQAGSSSSYGYATKPSLDTIADSPTPGMTHSTTSSYDNTHEVFTPTMSHFEEDLPTPDAAEKEAETPRAQTFVPLGPLTHHLASGLISSPSLDSNPPTRIPQPSQFARASFGCEGSEADRERANIARSMSSPLAPGRQYEQYSSDSDDGVVAARNGSSGRSRDSFFGYGSVVSRSARRSHSSVHALPANHERMSSDLSHLGSFVLPHNNARKSVGSFHVSVDDPYTPPLPMRSQRSLNSNRSGSTLRRATTETAEDTVPPLPRKRPASGLLRKSRPSSKRLSKGGSIDWIKFPDGPPGPIIDLEKEKWSMSSRPSQRRMWTAGTSFLYDEDGNVLCFGDLFPRSDWKQKSSDDEAEGPPPRTVLFFIRSFWCGACQDYTLASIAQLDQELLKRHNVRVAVIASGHWKMLRPYRTLFKCPFPFYTDPTRKIYQIMGMTKYGSSLIQHTSQRASYHQNSLPVQAVKGFYRGIHDLPLGYNIGNPFQLGGEFVLAPGYRCEFAHRMSPMGDHMEASDVILQAGVDHPAVYPQQLSDGELAAREELDREAFETSRWQEERDRELERMKLKKIARRTANASFVVSETVDDTMDIGLGWEKQQQQQSSDWLFRDKEWDDYVASWLGPEKERASRPPSIRVPSPGLLGLGIGLGVGLGPLGPPLTLGPTLTRSSSLMNKGSISMVPAHRRSNSALAGTTDQTTKSNVGGGRIPVPTGAIRTSSIQLARKEAPENVRLSSSPKPPYRPVHSPKPVAL